MCKWVPLAHVDDAKSLLPPGAAESPDSRTYSVNVKGWENGKLHPAPLSRKALEPFITSRKEVKPLGG